MSTDPSTPSTTPVRMREDRSEKGIWMATSSNVRGTDGDSTYKPANDRRIQPSPSTAFSSGSKEIKFRWRYRRTSPSPFRKNHFGTTELRGPACVTYQKNTPAGCSKRHPTRPQASQNRRRTLGGTLRILTNRERRWMNFSAS